MTESLDISDSVKKSMQLNPGCVLAYSVWELSIDVKDGSFKVVLDKDNRGKFYGEDEVDSAPSILGETSP